MIKYWRKSLIVNNRGKLVEVKESMGEWNTIIKFLAHQKGIIKTINFESGKGVLYDKEGTMYFVNRASTIIYVRNVVKRIDKINSRIW